MRDWLVKNPCQKRMYDRSIVSSPRSSSTPPLHLLDVVETLVSVLGGEERRIVNQICCQLTVRSVRVQVRGIPFLGISAVSYTVYTLSTTMAAVRIPDLDADRQTRLGSGLSHLRPLLHEVCHPFDYTPTSDCPDPARPRDFFSASQVYSVWCSSRPHRPHLSRRSSARLSPSENTAEFKGYRQRSCRLRKR